MLGVGRALAWPYCGSTTGKLFMTLGSATERPVTGAVYKWFAAAAILAPEAMTSTAVAKSNAATAIMGSMWRMCTE